MLEKNGIKANIERSWEEYLPTEMLLKKPLRLQC